MATSKKPGEIAIIILSSIIYTHCPVCGSASIHKAISAVDYTASHEHFDIFQCAGCCLRFTQNIPDAADIGKYYRSSEYISHTDTRKGLINRLYHLVRKFTLSSKRRLIHGVTGLRTGDLLDVGAGTGAFLNHMKTAGWTVSGIEQDTQASANAASLYGVQLAAVPALFEFQDESFDAITMWHVLEHVHDLHGYTEQLKKLCKPEGRIFIAVPNYTSYDAGKYSAFWAAYDVPRHLYHFSPAAMGTLLQEHGLKVIDIRPMWFDSFYVSMLSEKYKYGRPNLPRGFWRGLISNIKAMSNKRRASSVIYVVSRA